MGKLISGLFVFAVCTLIFAITLDSYTTADYEILDIAKPITVIQYSAFLSFALFLELISGYLIKLSNNTKRLLIIIAFLIILASFLETLWAYNYWFTSFQVAINEGQPNNAKTLDMLKYSPNPDLSNPYQELRIQRGLGETLLNRMAKRDVLVFMVSVYFQLILRYFLQ